MYADPNKNKPIAIIVPVENALKKLAHENGIKGDTLEELAHSEKLNGVVLKQMQGAGRRGGLSGIEIIDGLAMADEEWTPQNVSLRDYSRSYCCTGMLIGSGLDDLCTED